jgi:hypothetical protein
MCMYMHNMYNMCMHMYMLCLCVMVEPCPVSTPDGVSKVCACLALCSHVHMKARRAPGICSLYKGKSTATWL